MTFEQQLSELETLVDKMEKGEISLEDSLSSFEQGIKLARSCQKSLKDAELKVKILLDGNDENTNGQNSTLSDFEE